MDLGWVTRTYCLFFLSLCWPGLSPTRMDSLDHKGERVVKTCWALLPASRPWFIPPLNTSFNGESSLHPGPGVFPEQGRFIS